MSQGINIHPESLVFPTGPSSLLHSIHASGSWNTHLSRCIQGEPSPCPHLARVEKNWWMPPQPHTYRNNSLSETLEVTLLLCLLMPQACVSNICLKGLQSTDTPVLLVIELFGRRVGGAAYVFSQHKATQDGRRKKKVGWGWTQLQKLFFWLKEALKRSFTMHHVIFLYDTLMHSYVS